MNVILTNEFSSLVPTLYSFSIEDLMSTAPGSHDSSENSTGDRITPPGYVDHHVADTMTSPTVLTSLTLTAQPSVPTDSRDRCRRCQQMVYVTERIGPVKSSLYHKLCFKCFTCERQLDFKTYFTNSIDLSDKEIYCQSHAPKSGKGVFSTDNIHIQNVMKAPKLNVAQKLDDRLKVS